MHDQCLFCGASLIDGYAELHASLAESLFRGAAPRTLIFEAGETAEIEILNTAERRAAASCMRCGAFIILSVPWAR